MKILITGAGGFVGNYLSKYFGDHEVTSVKSHELDLADPTAVSAYFQSHKFDAVVNCAAKGRYHAMSQDQDILATNLKIFANLSANRDSFHRLVNIGSGAEFGLTRNIDQALESEIFNHMPPESYGLSKNLITRAIHQIDHFHNVRLFGCFDASEPSGRLISGFLQQYQESGQFTVTNDRYADYVCLQDLALLIDCVLHERVLDKDINMVYPEKLKLSEILKLYCRVHDLDASGIAIKSESDNHYTGHVQTLSKYQINFLGWEKGLAEYKS